MPLSLLTRLVILGSQFIADYSLRSLDGPGACLVRSYVKLLIYLCENFSTVCFVYFVLFIHMNVYLVFI